MINPYEPSCLPGNADQTAIADLRTTIAFWVGSAFGAGSWLTAALTYQFGIEALYFGRPASHLNFVIFATLALGIGSCALLVYGYHRRSKHPEHRWSPTRFVIVGIPACLPVSLLIFMILDGLGI